MRFSAPTMICAVCALTTVTAGARAQTLHLVQPVDSATVRETVPFRVQPGDLPKGGGYVEVKIGGPDSSTLQFRTARVLPDSAASPVYLWDTQEEGANAVSDGAHTVEIDIYDNNSNLIGTATVHLNVANQIAPPSQDLKLVYHWASQHHLVYHRVSDMTIPGLQGKVATPSTPGTPEPSAGIPDQTLQASDLEFVRTTNSVTAAQSAVRDQVTSGTLTDHGLRQQIKNLYEIAPYQRTVNARGEVLGSADITDFADHIGFSIPQLPARRVGKGDSWQADVQVPLNWDASSAAHVTAECQLEDFEWQDGYPCAKIVEKYSGPANFTATRGFSGGNHPTPKVNASAVSLSRVIFFSYNSGRLIKETTDTQITLTAAQMNSLGGSIPPTASTGDEMGRGGERTFGAPMMQATPTTGILDTDETTEFETP